MANTDRVSSPSFKVFLNIQATDIDNYVDITPAGIEADSSFIRAVRAHHALAVHQPITSMPPSSSSSQKTTPPQNTTPALALFVVTLASLISHWRTSR
ncbi:hypothetical protein MRX96_046955 [Rhipicephalus microplus]